ncbi:MAG: hypothetical protein RL333_70 [Pseudomonadota bacterium]|jgi:hypothetical protein
MEKPDAETQRKVQELNLKLMKIARLEGIQVNVIYTIARKD